MGDYDARTALHLAATEGQTQVVNMLLQTKSINVTVRDRWGSTPVEDARRNGHLEIVVLLETAMERDETKRRVRLLAALQKIPVIKGLQIPPMEDSRKLVGGSENEGIGAMDQWSKLVDVGVFNSGINAGRSICTRSEYENSLIVVVRGGAALTDLKSEEIIYQQVEAPCIVGGLGKLEREVLPAGLEEKKKKGEKMVEQKENEKEEQSKAVVGKKLSARWNKLKLHVLGKQSAPIVRHPLMVLNATKDDTEVLIVSSSEIAMLVETGHVEQSSLTALECHLIQMHQKEISLRLSRKWSPVAGNRSRRRSWSSSVEDAKGTRDQKRSVSPVNIHNIDTKTPQLHVRRSKEMN